MRLAGRRTARASTRESLPRLRRRRSAVIRRRPSWIRHQRLSSSSTGSDSVGKSPAQSAYQSIERPTTPVSEPATDSSTSREHAIEDALPGHESATETRKGGSPIRVRHRPSREASIDFDPAWEIVAAPNDAERSGNAHAATFGPQVAQTHRRLPEAGASRRRLFFGRARHQPVRSCSVRLRRLQYRPFAGADLRLHRTRRPG